MSPLSTTLDDLISNGVALDLFEAKQARLLLDHIGSIAQAINAMNFGRFFGQLQITLGRQFVLMMCGLFEQESRSYKLRSIPAVLKFLDDNRETLQIQDRPRVVKLLVDHGDNEALLNALSDNDLTAAVVSAFHSILPISTNRKHDLSEAVFRLRAFRDKSVAHHEVIEVSQLPGIMRHDIDALMLGASQFVKVVGPSYLGVHHDIDSDARKTELSLEKLLRAARIYE